MTCNETLCHLWAARKAQRAIRGARNRKTEDERLVLPRNG